MCRVGYKAPFPPQHIFGLPEQLVHCQQQRLNFFGQSGRRQRRQIAFGTMLNFAGKFVKRKKFDCNHDNHHQQQGRQPENPRADKLLSHIPGDVLPVVKLLSDGNDILLVSRINPDNPPFFVIDPLLDITADDRRIGKIAPVLVIMKNFASVLVKNGKTDSLVFIIGIGNIIKQPVGCLLNSGRHRAPVGCCQLAGQGYLICIEKFIDFFFGFLPRQNAGHCSENAGDNHKQDNQPQPQT